MFEMWLGAAEHQSPRHGAVIQTHSSMRYRLIPADNALSQLKTRRVADEQPHVVRLEPPPNIEGRAK